MEKRSRTITCLFLLLVLSTGLVSCGKGNEETLTAESVSSQEAKPQRPKQELVAASVELPYGDENGPHPDNLTEVQITRGSYTIPEFEDEPGFEMVDRWMAMANEETAILTEMEENVAMAGRLQAGDLFFILSEEEDGWLYVESNKVRGFLKDPSMEAVDQSEFQPAEAHFATQLLSPEENKAFFYKFITAEQNPAPVIFAIPTKKAIPILEEPKEEARTIGTLAKNGTAYVLEGGPVIPSDVAEGWLYVESGYVRGFIQESDVVVGEKADEWMREQENWTFTQAVAEIPFNENKAAYYTVTSVDPGRSAYDQAREYMQILGHERKNELEIPETFSGRRVGHIFSCTPDYGSRSWMFEALDVFHLWQQYGSVYQDNIAMIDAYYLIACTSTYGEVGDYVTFYLDDGTPLHCIIADQKSPGDEHYTSYGHIHGNDIDVIEAETLYNINPGQEGCAPDWNGHRVCSCVNHGKFVPF